MHTPFRHPLATHPAGTILGYRRNGTPIYAIAGGSDEGDAGSATDASTADTSDAQDAGQEQQDTADSDDDSKTAAKQDDTADSKPARDSDGGTDWKAHARKWEQRAKENAESTKTAVEAAVKEATEKQARELAKALGLVKEDDKTPPDPAKLQSQIETLQSQFADKAAEAAIYRGASKYGADPDSLRDSRSFMSALKGLDPTASDYDAQVAKAIKKAVDDNPKHRAQPAAPARTSGDFSGSTEKPATKNSIEAQREARRKARLG
ncbi:hypothetical protein ACIQTN_25785 [Streptomyces werraensis]|uniref:hypothetical protein n=1 Tax=Streptomyces werraensis TaxID=68284 RepID=UPI0037FF9C5E